MKTTVLFICCSAIVFSADAQIDTSRNAFKSPTDTSRNAFRTTPPLNQNPALQNTTPVQPPMQYRVEDRILIQHNELPNSLRETLMENQYKGWENSEIYQDRVSGEYYYTPTTNTNTQSQQSTYLRFDRNGKAISETKTGNNDQQ
jgi:hypothetical protein